MIRTGHRRFSREIAAGYVPAVLESAKVLVVGVGALGQNLAMDLALVGVGTLAVVDLDRFEQHNSPRSPLYPSEAEQARLGLGKAVTVAHALRRFCTASIARVLYRDGPIQALCLGAISEFDAVVSAVDADSARAYLAEACRRAAVPLIMGGFEGEHVNFSVYANESEREPCWRCSTPVVVDDHALSCTAVARLQETRGITPAIQPAASVLGSLMAEAVIETLHGRAQLAGHRVTLDVRRCRCQVTRLAQAPDCPGAHRPDLGATVMPFDVLADARVEDLLRALERRGIKRPVVSLPSPLIGTAPCGRCGVAIEVNRPLADLAAAPACASACTPSIGTLKLPPMTRAELSWADEDLLGIPCPTVGLGPLSVWEAFDEESGQGMTFMRIGHLADVFREVSKS